MAVRQGAKGYLVNEACIHTSATPGDWWQGKTPDDVLDAFWQWHVVERGWRKIGYQRVIMPDGEVIHDNGNRLRSITEIGAGVANHNRGVIHICLIPVNTVDRIGRFADFYTNAQRVALRDYLFDLESLVGVGKLSVSGHNDYANKLCPGFKVVSSEWL